MKYKKDALLPFVVACLAFWSLVHVASADTASPEQKPNPAIYIWSRTDITGVKDEELSGIYREADASLINQIKDGFASRGMKVNAVESERDIAADPARFVLIVRVDKIELGAKRPFGRTAKVKVSYTLQNKDRHNVVSRSHEETSAKRWQNCIKKISDQTVDDVSNDIAKKSAPGKPEDTQGKLKQAPTGTSSEARLQELENLKAKGLITEKEYEAKRKEILNQL
jgi:hypothetical protein